MDVKGRVGDDMIVALAVELPLKAAPGCRNICGDGLEAIAKAVCRGVLPRQFRQSWIGFDTCNGDVLDAREQTKRRHARPAARFQHGIAARRRAGRGQKHRVKAGAKALGRLAHMNAAIQERIAGRVERGVSTVQLPFFEITSLHRFQNIGPHPARRLLIEYARRRNPLIVERDSERAEKREKGAKNATTPIWLQKIVKREVTGGGRQRVECQQAIANMTVFALIPALLLEWDRNNTQLPWRLALLN